MEIAGILAGSGVVAAGAGPALVALAARTRCGVLNTYAAKGLFAWDDPAHLGTVGLQRDDLELAGVGEHWLAIGVAEEEVTTGVAGARPVPVSALLAGTLEVSVASDFPPRPALYQQLAGVCGPGYLDDTVPLSPLRAVGDLASWLPASASVVAGAGLPGFWLGRAFPTRRAGSVVLPVSTASALAEEVGRRARAGEPVVVITDDADGVVPTDLGPSDATVVVERWTPDGPVRDPGQRLAALSAAFAAGGGEVAVGVSIDNTAALEAVAGPITAWGGPARWR
jgi:hypothetical protein